MVLDFDAQGNVVGIDIDHASRIVDLSRLEAESFPQPSDALGSTWIFPIYFTNFNPRANHE
jgi:hypothetical protein